MEIVPAIDLINGACVRLKQGNFESKTEYERSPIEVALDFEKQGAKRLHVVDLDGARKGSSQNKNVLIDILNVTNLEVDYGGGIRTTEEVDRLFELGVSMISVGSIAVEHPELIADWVKNFGSERIIVSADMYQGKIVSNGWQKNSGICLVEFCGRMESAGVSKMMCTDVEKDGMMEGANLNAYQLLRSKFPNLKFIASGGVKSKQDLDDLRRIGMYEAIVGKLLYEKKDVLVFE